MQGRSETGAFVQLNKYYLSSMARFKKRPNDKWLFDKEQQKYLDVFELSPYELKMIEIDMGSTEVRDYLNDAYIARGKAHEHAQAHQQTPQRNETPMTQAPIMKATSQPVTRQDNRAYINEDVTRSEARAIDLIKAELNPHLINQRDYGIDLQTDIGPIDVQYTSSGRPILDLISWGHLKGYQGKLAPFSEAQAIHRTINNDINQGANLQDVMQRLNSLGVTIGKPGKILNTDAYPSVAFLTKQGNVFSNPMAIDMAAVRQTLTDNPMRDLGAKVYFNNKLKYPRSRNDTFESAMVMLNDPAILKDFNITNRFF